LQLVPLRLKASKPRETDFEPQTLGEHLRKRRLLLQINQKEAASRLGVTPCTVRHWETRRTHPAIEHIPAVIGFLGYDPFSAPTSIAERLLAKRRAMGWSIREAAAHLGVDPTTWGDWEHGKVILFRAHRALVAHLLGLEGGRR
jgi:transcriptional regulator with XRE-family HTH domain